MDTNVFVGAGFRPGSAAGAVVRAVREGRVRMPWSDATRREIEAVVRRIPPLSDLELGGMFREEDRVGGALDDSGLEWVGDPADRKFAALAVHACAALVSNDDHLLARRGEAPIPVFRSGEFAEMMGWRPPSR